MDLPRAVGQKARCCLGGHATCVGRWTAPDAAKTYTGRDLDVNPQLTGPGWRNQGTSVGRDFVSIKLHLACISPGKKLCCPPDKCVLRTAPKAKCLSPSGTTWVKASSATGDKCIFTSGLLHPGTEGLAPQSSWWLQWESLRAGLLDFPHPPEPSPGHPAPRPYTLPRGTARHSQGPVQEPAPRSMPVRRVRAGLAPCWGAGQESPLPLHRARAAILPRWTLLPGSSELPPCRNDADFESMSMTDKRKILTLIF